MASMRVAEKMGMVFEKEGEDEIGPFLLYAVSKVQGTEERATH